MRSVRAFLPVAGDPAWIVAVFEGSPEVWLPEAADGGDGHWSIRLYGSGLARTVRAWVGRPWSSGRTVWRSLSWDPTEPPTSPLAWFLPSCDAEIGIHRQGDRVTVVFDGRYRPPGGQLGVAVDALALSRIAQSTIGRLVADIADRLTEAASPSLGMSDRREDHDDRARDGR